MYLLWVLEAEVGLVAFIAEEVDFEANFIKQALFWQNDDTFMAYLRRVFHL